MFYAQNYDYSWSADISKYAIKAELVSVREKIQSTNSFIDNTVAMQNSPQLEKIWRAVF